MYTRVSNHILDLRSTLLTCVEDKPCQKNERYEKVWHKEDCVHVVLGQVTNVDPKESSDRRCHDQAVDCVPEDILGILHIVEFENLELELGRSLQDRQ